MHIRSNSNGQQNCLIIFSALARINAAAVKKGEKNPKLIKIVSCAYMTIKSGADFLEAALYLFLFLLLCVESVAVCLFSKCYPFFKKRIVSNITTTKEPTKLLSEKCHHQCFVHLKVCFCVANVLQ